MSGSIEALADALSKTATFGDHEERAQSIIDLLAVHDFRVLWMPAGSPLWEHFAPVICVGDLPDVTDTNPNDVTPEGSRVVDLMQALEDSVVAAKEARARHKANGGES